MRQSLFLILFFVITGCATQSTPSENVTFVDTEAFDKSLSNQMSAGLNDIEVAATSSFKMDEIPERLSKWLNKVVDYKGTLDVEPKPEKQAQSLEWLIGTLPTVYSVVYDYVDKKMMNSPAQYYNATIFYNQKSELVEKVVFSKKTQTD